MGGQRELHPQVMAEAHMEDMQLQVETVRHEVICYCLYIIIVRYDKFYEQQTLSIPTCVNGDCPITAPPPESTGGFTPPSSTGLTPFTPVTRPPFRPLIRRSF